MSRQLLLVGEDFGKTDPKRHKDKYALTGKSGARIASLMGLTVPQMARLAKRTNVVETPDRWRDRDAVLLGIESVRAQLVEYRFVVLLGARVSRAMGLGDRWLVYGPHTWHYVYGTCVAVAAHPSGRSRFWNDSDNVAVAREFWQDVATWILPK